jgi:hypothetical protein
VSERLFLFIQLEFPWPLDPPDGRYLLRSHVEGEPEHVVVLATLESGGGPPAHRPGVLRHRRRVRRRSVAPEPEPTPVASARATIVDPVSLSAERQAKAWLADLDAEREIPAALAVLNRVLYAQRIAAADPYARELSAAQALSVRAGWGEGEQVAEGRWLHAVELSVGGGSGRGLGGPAGGLPLRGRSAALRPHERLARLLGGREQALLCEELSLRARMDLDQGRIAHAALELDRAYTAALAELAEEQRGDLPLRVAELGSLREGVRRAAAVALGDRETDETPAPRPTTSRATQPAAGSPAFAREALDPEALDPETLGHALGRLEAVLRARTALGFEA